MQEEFKQLCSDPDVLFGDIYIGTLKAFSFSNLCATLELKAPVLMQYIYCLSGM